jgi:ferredoxin-NADP reductase
MYKLVIVLLAAIGVNALVLSLLGQLGYSPLALVASAAVALVVTNASSWAAAKIARVEPHLDSAFITGLLIFFIMQPKLDVLGLSGIAIAGVVASASKYVIAVRGRHILNPAAAGAIVPTLIVFTTFIGMSFGVWWVGTPYLAPAVVIAAFLVLYRTQRLTVGALFVVVAGAIATLVAVVGGQGIGPALGQVLLQSPIIFFAGFMFSEPLTLPPRRWQQLLELVVVAVLFTVPLPLGPVSNSPLFALLVGNVIAFLFGQRRAIRMAFVGKTRIGPSSWELAFRPRHPVRFSPGQYLELTIPHANADFRGSRRYFSISSAPGPDAPITVAMTIPTKSSSFKRALLELEAGDEVRGTGVAGDFVPPSRLDEPVLLVAGGIGITPFASWLAHAHTTGATRDVVVAYATSEADPLPYADLLERSGVRVVLFGPTPGTLPPSWSHGGEGRITGELLAQAVPDLSSRRAFVSGPPSLVSDLRAALRSQGVRHVHSDYFSGY